MQWLTAGLGRYSTTWSLLHRRHRCENTAPLSEFVRSCNVGAGTKAIENIFFPNYRWEQNSGTIFARLIQKWIKRQKGVHSKSWYLVCLISAKICFKSCSILYERKRVRLLISINCILIFAGWQKIFLVHFFAFESQTTPSFAKYRLSKSKMVAILFCWPSSLCCDAWCAWPVIIGSTETSYLEQSRSFWELRQFWFQGLFFGATASNKSRTYFNWKRPANGIVKTKLAASFEAFPFIFEHRVKIKADIMTNYSKYWLHRFTLSSKCSPEVPPCTSVRSVTVPFRLLFHRPILYTGPRFKLIP